jgi:Tfp pilus assembly protein PilN
MIRVNLLTDYSSTPLGTTDSGGTTAGTKLSIARTVAGIAGASNIIGKIFLAVVPIMVLLAYEQYNIGSLRTKIEALRGEQTNLKEQTTKLNPEIQAAKNLNEQKEKLKKQIDTIRLISKERLQPLKALYAIQSIIPTKAWISSLRMEQAQVELSGIALDGQSVSDFMKGLEDSIYFMDIQLINSEETQLPNGTSQRNFSLKCKLENP